MVAPTDLGNKLSQFLGQMGKGTFDVTPQTHYNVGGLDKEDVGVAGITLVIDNPGLESNNLLPREILAQLSRIPALSENVQFESEHAHVHHLAERLREFIAAGADVPESFAQWFEKQAEKDAAPRPDHALKIEKTDVGVRVRIEMPKDMDPTLVANAMEQAKASIVTNLADRVGKYYTPEAKEKAIAQIKALDVAISPVKNEYQSFIDIELRSPEQLAKVKTAENKWSVMLDAEEAKTLRASNPLNGLPEGDGSPENPALLQKALARAFFFDNKKPRDYFPQIAGNKDMQIAIGKALTNLAASKPDLAEKVQKFLTDDMFKEHDQWHRHSLQLAGGQESGNDKGMPRIEKIGDASAVGNQSQEYKPGRIRVNIPLPANKFNAIMAELAAWSPDAPQQRPVETTPMATTSSPIVPENSIASASLAAVGATPEVAAAGAANLQICPEGHAALSASGAAATPEAALAAAGGACIPVQEIPAPELTTSARGVTLPNGATIDSKTIQSFLAKQPGGGYSDRVVNTHPAAHSRT